MKNGFIFLAIIFLLTVVFLGQISFAEEALPMKINLSDAIKYSLQNNNSIRAMRKGLSATERNIGIARSAMLPKVGLLENFVVTNNPIEAFALKLNQTRAIPGDLSFGTLDYPGATTNFLTSGVIEQKILDRKSIIEIRMAKKEYSANGYLYLREQEDLANQVAHAYLHVGTDQERIKIAELAISAAKAHLSVAEARRKAGKGFESDILRLKLAVENKEQILISVQKDLDIGKRNLGLLLGLETSVEPDSPLPDIKLEDIDYYKRLALYRNDVKAAEIKVENAKNNIKAAQSDWYPTLSAVASYNLYNRNYPFGADGSNYIAGAYLKWMAFDGNKRKYEILKAKDKEMEAKESLAGFKKEVGFRVYEAYAKIEESQNNLKLAIEAQKQAELNVVEVEKLWQDSKLPLVSLTDAQINLNDARVNTLNRRNDLRSSLIDLTYESGIICQELVSQ